MKGYAAGNNKHFTMTDANRETGKAINRITVEEWKNHAMINGQKSMKHVKVEILLHC